jgi:predicted transcriptional regulator of viral defense system
MRIREFEFEIADLPVFNLNDIRKLDPDFYRQQLSDWLDRGFIQPIADGYYTLANRVIDERLLFFVANKICEPSYISVESALAYYQVIPETVLGVTCVSSRKTKQFESIWGSFSYQSVKPIYMFGYEVINGDGKNKFKIARLEKVILDYLYLNPHISRIEDFEGLRWDKAVLADLNQNHLFTAYPEIFNKRSLELRVAALWRYLDA